MPVSSAAVAKRPTKRPASHPRPAARIPRSSSQPTAGDQRRSASRPNGPARPRSAGRRSRPNARRLPIAIAAVIALVIVGTRFTAAGLLRQHQQLASSSAQLQKLQHQNQLLTQQQQQLTSKTEIQRFARQYYQLVLPGATLFNVLPPTGHTASAAGSAPTDDPGSQPLVSPADAPNMTPDPGLPPGGASGTGGSSSGGTSGST
ncbi:MAG: septum formation initiator family protein, partial [Acidimicrobiales bacterium]